MPAQLLSVNGCRNSGVLIFLLLLLLLHLLLLLLPPQERQRQHQAREELATITLRKCRATARRLIVSRVFTSYNLG